MTELKEGNHGGNIDFTVPSRGTWAMVTLDHLLWLSQVPPPLLPTSPLPVAAKPPPLLWTAPFKVPNNELNIQFCIQIYGFLQLCT